MKVEIDSKDLIFLQEVAVSDLGEYREIMGDETIREYESAIEAADKALRKVKRRKSE
mgnify:CR=1 FL=1